jgi:hypothetical protein
MSHLRRDVERLSKRVLPSISNKPTTERSILTVIRKPICRSASARVAAGSVSPKIGRKHCCINVAESAQVKLGAKLRSYMVLALITEAIRRGSAPYCGIPDWRNPLRLKKLTDYQGNDSSLIRSLFDEMDASASASGKEGES